MSKASWTQLLRHDWSKTSAFRGFAYLTKQVVASFPIAVESDIVPIVASLMRCMSQQHVANTWTLTPVWCEVDELADMNERLWPRRIRALYRRLCPRSKTSLEDVERDACVSAVGLKPTSANTVELESTPLDHSGTLTHRRAISTQNITIHLQPTSTNNATPQRGSRHTLPTLRL